MRTTDIIFILFSISPSPRSTVRDPCMTMNEHYVILPILSTSPLHVVAQSQLHLGSLDSTWYERHTVVLHRQNRQFFQVRVRELSSTLLASDNQVLPIMMFKLHIGFPFEERWALTEEIWLAVFLDKFKLLSMQWLVRCDELAVCKHCNTTVPWAHWEWVLLRYERAR